MANRKGRRGSHKYGARKTSCLSGHSHPSRKEAQRCNELMLMVKAGVITDLHHEVQFWFHIDEQPLKHRNGRRCGYKVDFTYREIATGQLVAEEVKGYVVRDYALRRALFEHLNPDYQLKEI